MNKDRRSSFSQLGFRSGADKPATPLNGCIDHAVLGLGCLILVGWLPVEARRPITRIRLPGEEALKVSGAFVTHVRDDVNAAFERAGRPAPFKAGFVLSVPLSKEWVKKVRACIDASGELEVAIEVNPGVEEIFRAGPIGLGRALKASTLSKQWIQMAAQSLSVGGAKDASHSVALLKGIDSTDRIDAHIDVCMTADRRSMLVGGWVDRCSQSKLWLVDGELLEPAQALDPVFLPRADVLSHLRGKGLTPTTDQLGILFVAQVHDTKTYRICRAIDGDVAWSSELTVVPNQESLHVFLGTARRLAFESGTRGGEGFRKIAQALSGAVTSRPPDISDVHRFEPERPTGRPCRSSIIIPFYGDAFYLVDHLMAQSRAPTDVEWIIVCDDPRLTAQLFQTISNRRCLIRQPITLVILGSNGGFAHANNIGARYAAGEYLLLMNSDILCESFSFLDYGAKLLDADKNVGVVGYSLQFEDGTIQHDGMKFQKAKWLDMLWACEHANKGMPQAWTGFSHVEVEAVTAALMLVRRADFVGGDLFDPSYIFGDFEDADLCMRLRQDGKAIHLVRTPGLYHLERQSVRHAANVEFRQAVTHLNSLTFNERWAGMIEERSA